MNWITPRLAGINSMRIRTRLSLLVFVMLLPMIVLLVAAFNDRQEVIASTKDEQAGLQLIVVGNKLLSDVQTHRDLSHIVRGGDVSQKDALARARIDVEADLKALDAEHRQNGDRFSLQSQYAEIKDRWARIADMGPGEAPSKVWEAHTGLVNEGIFPWIFVAGNNSGLAMDPDSGSANAIMAVKDSLPLLTEQQSLVRGLGAAALVTGQGAPISPAVKQAINDNMARVDLLGLTFKRNLDEAIRANPQYKEALSAPLLRSTSDGHAFVDAINRELLTVPALKGNPSAFFISGSTSINTTNKILTATQDVLGKEFTARKASARSQMYRSGGLAFMTIGIAFLLVIVIAASITRPISQLVEVADRISLGELDAEIDISGANEVGQLAESLRRMQTSLRSAIERLRTRRAAA